jgi:peptidyl-prolyl cis-trans isomerase SurA
MNVKQITAFGVAILLLLSGCKSRPKITAETAAMVNGKEIKISDVEKRFRNQTKQSNQSPSPEEALTLKLQILEQLIKDEILMQRASKDKLEATEAEISTKFTDFKKNFTEEKFQQLLKDQEITADDIRSEYRKSSTIEKLYNKEITSKIAVSDAEISEFYNSNKKNFNMPETWHVQHILVTPYADQQTTNSKGNDAKTPQEAQQKVVQLFQQIKEGGADFGTVAREYSEDPNSAPNGGDLQFLAADQMEQSAGQAFRQAVQSLKPGEVYPKIVPSQFGYHIIKVLGKEPAGQRELSDPRVASNIRQTIFDRRENLLKTAYLDSLMNEALIINVLAQKILEDMGKTAQPALKK